MTWVSGDVDLTRWVRIVDARLNETFAAHGLDAASFDVLATLRRSGAPYRLTPSDLMRDAMVTSGAVTQRLGRLEGRGLVIREPNAADRRGVHVTLTAEGLALIDRALPEHVATEHRVLAGLSGADQRQLADMLRALLESLGDRRD